MSAHVLVFLAAEGLFLCLVGGVPALACAYYRRRLGRWWLAGFVPAVIRALLRMRSYPDPRRLGWRGVARDVLRRRPAPGAAASWHSLAGGRPGA